MKDNTGAVQPKKKMKVPRDHSEHRTGHVAAHLGHSRR